MTTTLDNVRNADDATLRVVWRFGGYETARGPYPGRRRALFIIFARDVLQTQDERESRKTTHAAAVCTLSAAWSVAIIATGCVPRRHRGEDLAHAPRACRIARRHPFRSAVRCTAPPARRVRSGRPMQDT